MPPLLDLTISILVFGIIAAATVAAVRLAEGMWDVRRRLGPVAEARATRATSLFRKEQVNNPVLLWIQSSTSLSDIEDRRKIRKELAMAGFDDPAAPIWFVIARFGLAIGAPFAFLAVQPLLAKPVSGLPLILITLGLCGLGLIAPRAFVDNRTNARRAQLEREFPDALDLVVVCVEAGLGLEAAFIRVGEDTRESHPRISEAFNRMSDELRAGRSRAEALRSMAERCDIDSVRSFVALLIQTDTLGTSIGQTLRTYAAEMREHRFLRAEEKAMRIPVLMTIPLVACILPVIITAVMLPPIIDVVRTLLPTLAGHHHH
jgi:tight adherence protein C